MVRPCVWPLLNRFQDHTCIHGFTANGFGGGTTTAFPHAINQVSAAPMISPYLVWQVVAVLGERGLLGEHGTCRSLVPYPSPS